MTSLSTYLKKRGLQGSWSLQGRLPEAMIGAVVIPSLAEGDELFATLDSLDACSPDLRQRFAVVVVVNCSESASESVVLTNIDDLNRLRQRSEANPDRPLAWIDATTDDCAFSVRDAGVGLARKLGFDLLIAEEGVSASTILVSLDADTRVRVDYLDALVRHFEGGRNGGCVIPFRHRDADDSATQAAIVRYELYMRSFVEGLRSAGSPYAYHAVGSALACSCEAYVRAGGMNRRKGGEDFYFLQQLQKSSGVSRLSGTLVYPSPRPSDRAPFGTGQVVARGLAGEQDAVRFHAPQSYRVLREWLDLLTASRQLCVDELRQRARAIHGLLAQHLEKTELLDGWERLKSNFNSDESFVRGLHAWFDGLRTLQLLHALEECWPRHRSSAVVAAQMDWAENLSEGELLLRLRRLQGAIDQKRLVGSGGMN